MASRMFTRISHTEAPLMFLDGDIADNIFLMNLNLFI